MVAFYERTLDSFADEIITRVSKASSSLGWYAALDVGPKTYGNEPDFATYAATKDGAVALCAMRIRGDARGIGKYAPHSILQGYDLHFRLAPYWEEKERKG